MASRDAGYFLEAEPIGIADIFICNGGEKRKIKDDAGSSI